MATPLRVLMVEDSSDDALLIERELRRGGYELDVVRVETELALRGALESRTFDLVLSDFSMPLFDGLAAYDIVRQYAPDIPFIFVSGRIGEERAADAMRRGVNDYVLKDNLARLLPAVRRELAQVEVVRARRTADQALRESEEKYRQLVEHSLQGLMIVQKGRIAFCNRATARMFGYGNPEELIGTEALNVVHPDDRHEALTGGRGLLNGSAKLLPEYRGIRKDGAVIWYEAHAAPTTWQGRRAIQWALLDITVRKRAEEELKANQRLLETVIDTIPHALLVKDQEGRYLMVNQAWCERYGLEREQVLGRRTREVPGRPPEALERAAEEDRRVFEAGRALVFEGVGTIRGGQRRDFQTTKAPLRDETGAVRGLVGVVVDLTELKKAEQELRAKERLLSTVFETMPHAVFVKDHEGRYLAVNRAWCERYHCAPENAIGKRTLDVPGRPETDKLRAAEEDYQVMHVQRRPISFQGEDHTSDGRTLHFQSYKAPLLDESGTVTGLVGVVVDTTDIKRTEAELRASQRLLQTVFDTIPHILIVKNLESRYLMVNKAWCDAYGIPPAQALGRKAVDVGGRPAEEINLFMDEDRQVLMGRTYTGERFYTLRGGERRLLQAIKTPLRDETGAVAGLVGVFVDRTAERKAQHDADVAHARLLDAIESLPVAFLLFDAQERLVLWNTRVQEFFPEFNPALKPGTAFEELLRLAAPGTLEADADREAWIAGRLAQFRERLGRFEQRLRSGRWIEGVDWRTSDGGTVCLRLDVTDAKNREAQLRQAQKMEVVGQLTGGVAHDLNNLLQVISGSALMAQRGLDPGRNEAAFLTTAIDACMRAAGLTRQLLAFSRKQVLQPRPLNLNTVLEEMMTMLSRVLPGVVAVELRTDPEVPEILADRGLLEQVVMNLAVNARDAMPEGGTLTLVTGRSTIDEETARTQPWAVPGEYVVLRVRDTGTGMTPEVMQHLFEPFFTTKEPGKGTGLGLSTVYGIVKQHGGLIRVQSAPSTGTEFVVYWPVRSAAPPVKPPQAAAPSGGSETVLVVEDNPAVLRLTSDVLRSAGYQVVAAESGPAALEALQARSGTIAAAILDLMMPRMSGIECYQKLTAIRPGLPVLFCSGWSSEEHNQFLEERHLPLLAKPYSPAQLLESLRRVLDSPPAGGAETQPGEHAQ